MNEKLFIYFSGNKTWSVSNNIDFVNHSHLFQLISFTYTNILYKRKLLASQPVQTEWKRTTTIIIRIINKNDGKDAPFEEIKKWKKRRECEKKRRRKENLSYQNCHYPFSSKDEKRKWKKKKKKKIWKTFYYTFVLFVMFALLFLFQSQNIVFLSQKCCFFLFVMNSVLKFFFFAIVWHRIHCMPFLLFSKRIWINFVGRLATEDVIFVYLLSTKAKAFFFQKLFRKDVISIKI